MKLTIIEWIMNFLGYGYVINLRSKEIHRLKTKHSNCRLNQMKRKKYVTKDRAMWLMNFPQLGKGWNGCRYCFSERDLG